MFKRVGIMMTVVFLLIIPISLALTEIEVDEGDLIKLKLKAADADGDPLTYEFLSPLNKDGEWQTGYEDAGEYSSSVTVTDNKGATTKEDIRIIINNVNLPPEIRRFDRIEVQETDFIDLHLPDTDIDGDKITYKISKPLNNKGKWQTGYDDAGIYEITLTASDNDLTDRQEFTLVVHDKDRTADFTDIERNITEGESFSISFPEEDPDGDVITYSGELVYDSRIDENEFSWTPGYDVVQYSPNWLKKKLFLVGIGNTDKNKIRKLIVPVTARTEKSVDNFTMTFFVRNKNRAPMIEEVEDISIFETESFNIRPVVKDFDNDPVRVSFSGSLETYKYDTDYDDAG
ncbi:hypothetical protein GF371_05020, partial [Candidatus Woesearchaeota archaeon]|nr:hypothetical protein [Candidatus Woesearchaeota archaeon]